MGCVIRSENAECQCVSTDYVDDFAPFKIAILVS
jgi:hypothetical protein